MIELTEKQIRKDNPHFGPVIREVGAVKSYKSKIFPQLTHVKVVGAHDSDFGDGEAKFDAWASYLYNSEYNCWVLGAN